MVSNYIKIPIYLYYKQKQLLLHLNIDSGFFSEIHNELETLLCTKLHLLFFFKLANKNSSPISVIIFCITVSILNVIVWLCHHINWNFEKNILNLYYTNSAHLCLTYNVQMIPVIWCEVKSIRSMSRFKN